MFAITGHKGYHMTFKNGWTVSVQWGPGNYVPGAYKWEWSAPKVADYWESDLAEIAAWDGNKKWFSFGDDEVKGRVTADEVADFIAKIQGMEAK